MGNVGVVTILSEDGGSAYWRGWIPAKMAEFHEYPATVAMDQATFDKKRFQIVNFPRFGCAAHVFLEVRNWISRLHDQGLIVIGDYDDDIFTDAVYQQAQSVQPGITREEHQIGLEQNRRGLAMLDGVTVTNERVATVVAGFTSAPIAIVPNYIPWRMWKVICGPRPLATNVVTIGWVGGIRQQGDTAPLAGAWRRVHEEYGKRVQFVIAGQAPDDLYRAAPSATTVIPWRHWREYPKSYQGIDILCCPLEDTPFNRCKTPIKAYEGACAGSMVIASDTLYGDVMHAGEDGLLIKNNSEVAWTLAIAHMIEDPEARAIFTSTWVARVRAEFNLETKWGRWPTAWNELFECSQRRRVLVGL